MNKDHKESVDFFKKILEVGEFKGEKVEEVGMYRINPGDAILCDDGEFRTVCKSNIKYDSFTGYAIFGNSYMSGYQKAVRAIYPIWKNGTKTRG